MPTKPTLDARVSALEDGGLEERVSALEEKMEVVLSKPAHRQPTERGVCILGFTPSEECPDGSLGKYQKGCHGFKCLAEQAKYFRDYRAHKAAAAKKAAPTKVTVKKAAAAAKAPQKKAPARSKAPKAAKDLGTRPLANKRSGVKRRSV